MRDTKDDTPRDRYTKEEWGIGASSGGGDHNLIRSFDFSLFLTVLVALPASLFALALGVLMLFEAPLLALAPLFFGLLFGLKDDAVVAPPVRDGWRNDRCGRREGGPRN